jgi:predicted XRE-type DNA-binding protein
LLARTTGISLLALPTGYDRFVSDVPDPVLFSWDEMRAALAGRDINTVYRLLMEADVSQRRIAELVSQSQSEVPEILKGRHVQSYDVLVRIAQGLNVPRA